MSWPDIFFKARKPPQQPVLPPPFSPSPDGTVPPEAPESAVKLASVRRSPPKVPDSSRLESTPSGSSTFPGASGVVLRPPVRAIAPQPPIDSPSTPAPGVDQAMAEADPLRMLRRTGPVHLTKRTAPEVKTEPVVGKMEPGPISPDLPSVPPPFRPETVAPSTPSAEEDSPFILPPDPAPTVAAKPPASPTPTQAAPPAPFRFGGIFRRKAKMTDVARVVLPPKREEITPPEPPGAVIPPAFPVAGTTGGLVPAETVLKASVEKPSDEKTPVPEEVKPSASTPDPVVKDSPSAKDAAQAEPVSVIPEAAKKTEVPAAGSPAPVAEEKAPSPKTEPADAKPKSEPADASIPLEQLSPPGGLPEKREFILANGERIFGKVLSETPEAIYLDHGTLGVLTLPRSQIAKRLIEIILINGDRIVGDVMAETPDTLYVRHASLGMLTVPRAQRSTRVVEAILKDGDRILGEVLGETESFTVIRSATLGTVTVPHNKVAMLNRKIEQIELKALPPSAPEIKDKPSG